MNREIQNNRGMALMTAVVGTILLTLTAAVVLNFTMRRFETTALRVDRWTAFHADEGAIQYVWARLTVDDVFQQMARDKAAETPPKSFVISSDPKVNPDLEVEALRLGKKDVTVEMTYNTDGNPATNDFRLRASTDYGT